MLVRLQETGVASMHKMQISLCVMSESQALKLAVPFR
jgi:hypothetical protein